MTNLWNGKATEMKKMNLQVYDLLVGSVNEGDHWTLLVIYPQEGKIIYMNSCGEGSRKVANCMLGFHGQKGFQGCHVTTQPTTRCHFILHVTLAKAGTTGTA
ncbi:hypothetical protein G5714_004434 [Onychostoma macrolepis]|uniref:Ubiquitin-like protease family profile domain-containing protein n=1 Tax=Onychostoma macrolepis TaxID=369639 RepID=A0A7J6D4Q5_9TELE|nr:hypothetical protein G5714_004434 [Onychostoma macrolepis]